MLRLPVLTISALAPLVISAYAASLGTQSGSGDYVGRGGTFHAHSTAKLSRHHPRKASRVEKWLSTQGNAYKQPRPHVINPASPITSSTETWMINHPVRYAADLAAGMDRSEEAGLDEAQPHSNAQQMLPTPPKYRHVSALKRHRITTKLSASRNVTRDATLQSKRFGPPNQQATFVQLQKSQHADGRIGHFSPFADGQTAVRLANSPAEIIQRALQGAG